MSQALPSALTTQVDVPKVCVLSWHLESEGEFSSLSPVVVSFIFFFFLIVLFCFLAVLISAREQGYQRVQDPQVA